MSPDANQPAAKRWKLRVRALPWPVLLVSDPLVLCVPQPLAPGPKDPASYVLEITVHELELRPDGIGEYEPVWFAGRAGRSLLQNVVTSRVFIGQDLADTLRQGKRIQYNWVKGISARTPETVLYSAHRSH
jgi:hypothetical protein